MRFFERKRLLYIFSLLSASLLLFSTGCANGRPDINRVSRTKLFMGTYVQVTLYDKALSAERLEEIADEVFSVGKHFAAKFNVYDSESELNQLNLNKKMEVSDRLFELLSTAEKIKEATSERFDIAVAPDLKRAGFYENMDEKLKNAIPERTLSNVGYSMDVATGEVELPEDMWLDLSAIAKGYIVDLMGNKLKTSGVDSFLINAGGDILCRTGEHKKKWTIGFNCPYSEGILVKFVLKDQALATSGDYEKFLELDDGDEVISHIIDPVAGEPLERKFSSITVITDSAMRADAYATAFMLFEPVEAVRRAEEIIDLEIFAVRKENGELVEYSTDGVKEFLFRGRLRK